MLFIYLFQKSSHGHRPNFKLEWDLPEQKTYFQTSKTLPYTWKERGRIANKMNVDDILNTSEYKENPDVRRKRKWREITHFFNVTRAPEYAYKSLEKCLMVYGGVLSVNNFVMAIMQEFKFPFELGMDNHLRFLYWALEGGQEDKADWRELAAALKVLTFFRMIKKSPVELICLIFDIFSESPSLDMRHRYHHNILSLFLIFRVSILDICLVFFNFYFLLFY